MHSDANKFMPHTFSMNHRLRPRVGYVREAAAQAKAKAEDAETNLAAGFKQQLDHDQFFELAYVYGVLFARSKAFAEAAATLASWESMHPVDAGMGVILFLKPFFFGCWCVLVLLRRLCCPLGRPVGKLCFVCRSVMT
jgi:hypothetical protein